MSALAAQRLQRRTDLDPTYQATRGHQRPVRDSATRGSARNVERSATQPAVRPSGRPATRPTARPTERPVGRQAARPVGRRAGTVTPTPQRLRKRPENRPVPAPIAAAAQTQLFRPRVENTAEVARRTSRAAVRTEGLRAHLRLVPRRRRVASILAPALVVVFVAMLGVTTFQTRMAESQVKLDQLQVRVDKARSLNEQLTRQRGELLSPARLGAEASRLKMVAADTVGFVRVDDATYRTVLVGGSVGASTPQSVSGTAP